MKHFLLTGNLLGLGALVITSLFYCLAPVHLEAAGLHGEAGKVVILQLISWIFLLAALQANLGLMWRRFSLVACFLTLGQSILIAILLPGL